MYVINTENCSVCGSCADNCPQAAIKKVDGQYVINQDECVCCGSCADNCPMGAIEVKD